MQKIHISYIFIGIFAIFSIIIDEWLIKSGKGFQLNPNTAFQNLIQTAGWEISSLPLLRFLLVQIAWLIKCFPYLFIGILLFPLCNQIKKWNSSYRLTAIISCGIIFLFSGAVAISIGIPEVLKNVLQAYSLLLLSILISGYIQKGWIFQSVGVCSFGIYLIHPFAMLGVKSFLPNILPSLSNEVSVLSMMTISIASFTISWIAISLMIRNKWIAKYTLGI